MTPEVSLVLGGLPVAAVLFVVIEVLKWGGFLKTGDQVRAAVLVVALVLGAAWASVQFAPQIGPIVTTLVTALVGVCVAVAAYQAKSGRND